MNRDQYFQELANCGNTDKSKVTRHEVFHRYYMQLSNNGLESLVERNFNMDTVRKSFDEDIDLNNIPLKRWDNLMPEFSRLVDKEKMKEIGANMSLCTCVCTLKTIAVNLSQLRS